MALDTLENVASLAVHALEAKAQAQASATDALNILTASPSPTSNALDILLGALPSSIASQIESQFSAEATSTATSISSSSSISTSSAATSTSSVTSTTSLSSTSSTASTSSTSLTTTTVSTSISSTTIATSTRSHASTSDTSAAAVSATSSAAAIADPSHLANGAVAGIAIGITAGAVFVILAVVFLLRRRQQGKSPFHTMRNSVLSRGSANRTYPEVAWLYDPTPSPPNGNSSSTELDSESALLAAPRRPEMSKASSERAPSIPPVGPLSPLLAPRIAQHEWSSVSGSSSFDSNSPPSRYNHSPPRTASSRNGSSEQSRRAINTIFEESHAF